MGLGRGLPLERHPRRRKAHWRRSSGGRRRGTSPGVGGRHPGGTSPGGHLEGGHLEGGHLEEGHLEGDRGVSGRGLQEDEVVSRRKPGRKPHQVEESPEPRYLMPLRVQLDHVLDDPGDEPGDEPGANPETNPGTTPRGTTPGDDPGRCPWRCPRRCPRRPRRPRKFRVSLGQKERRSPFFLDLGPTDTISLQIRALHPPTKPGSGLQEPDPG